ncbi:MAG: hypothetical protein NC203_12210 [Firmicutes bacterium]|nr:hypothetical protein [Bacillota bacterium]
MQDEDKIVLELSTALQNGSGYDFDRAFSVLFNWCQNALQECDQERLAYASVKSEENNA